MGLSYAKKSCRYLLPFEHNARTQQTDHGTVTSIPIGEIAGQRRRLIMSGKDFWNKCGNLKTSKNDMDIY